MRKCLLCQRVRMVLVLGAVFAACGWMPDANAEVPDTGFTYQGSLEDGDVPANGLYDFQFELFDVSSGSSISSISTHASVPVADGRFTVPDVDFGENPDIARVDAELEVRVRSAGSGSYTALSPRQPLTATPLAAQLRGVSVETNDHGSLMSAYDGSRVSAQWGTASTGSGTLGGWASPEGTNVRTTLLDADRDNDPDNGIAEGLLRVRGAGAGAEGGRVLVQNHAGVTSIALRGGVAGDFSVDLPDDAISASELESEPGVASAKVNGQATTLNASFGAPTVLESRVIDCPADGFVLVIGTCQLTASHFEGVRSFFEFGVSDDGLTQPNQDVAVTIPASESAGNRAYPITVHGLFEVDEGSNQFQLLGRQLEGGLTSDVHDVQLTLVYFPTAYGEVNSTLAGSGDGESRHVASSRSVR